MKRFFKVLSVLTAAIMLVGSCSVLGVSAETSVETAEQSVVLVAAGDGWGSGFAVGNDGEDPQYIVTNCHVISDESGNVYSSITVFFSAAANKYVSAEVVAANTSKDLCVLELPEPTSERKPLPLCKSENVSKGDEVFVLGYPAYSLAGKNYTTLDTKDITSTKGNISQKTRINNSGAIGTNVYMTDALIDNGNSGGPMINSNGEVIGVATWGNLVNENSGYATIIDELIPILNSNNVPYSTSGNGAAASANAADNASQGGNTLMIIVIAAAVVIIVTVIVIAVTKSKKREPAAAYAPEVKISQGAVITGMKGIMANRTFNVNGSLVLGRNPQKCSVCYPMDSKGISGVHCQIRQSGSGYEIMDLGSSNGTFLGSGQKLTPNVPVIIPDGTYFYLGSAEELFQIKY